MFTTVYISRSTTDLNADDLTALLTECRIKNRRRGLTGMLLYREGQFIQALEGPEYMVHATMDRIMKDPRHVEVEVLAEEEVKGRQFPGWSMGYREIDEAASLTMPGYRGVLTSGRGAAQSSTTEAKLLLEWFRAN
ncbi:BLUF domain-containing protein [uncultured Amnibacterium sp.]|uniref:BLUF domain-containing protein n=1 Tax=uncultured Amnibacterium sp. TaxID=1631851 RepID=UPI0035C996D3